MVCFCSGRLHLGRELVVGSTVESPASLALPHPSPLLEEERDALGPALALDRRNPSLPHGPCARATFTADNDPTDAAQVQVTEMFQEGLNG